MLKNYFKTAIKNLFRNKVFSIINISGLSVGLACCMLIFLYTKDEVSYDRFHEKKDVIYRIVANMTKPDDQVQKLGNTGMMPGPNFKREVPEVEQYLRVQSDNYTTRHGIGILNQSALAVDENFFSFFSFPLIQGDPKTALADLHSIVLSEEVAKKYFGKKEALGEILELKIDDKFVPFTVKGITKKSPQNSSLKIEMLVPMKFKQSLYDDKQWTNFFLNTFVILKKGTDISTTELKFAKSYNKNAAQEIKEVAEKYGFKDKIQFLLQPLLSMHLSKEYRPDDGLTDGSNPMYSYILSGIALLILLIACINFINLTVAHSLKRAKEIGIRKVIGGQRKQLIIQFLGESFILCSIAFLFAILLAQLLLPFFNTVSNKALSFSYLLDTKLVLGYIALFLVTGLLAGFYPAVVLSRFNPVETLYGRHRLASRNYLSKGLVIFQFTLATFLIVSTFIIYSQFNFLTHFDLGYNDKNVAIVNAGQINKDKLAAFKNELYKISSIKDISADMGGRWGTHAHINGEGDIHFDFKIIDEDYLPLLKIPITKGRNFSRDIPSDTIQAAVVNESFVKTAGWKDPIGQVVDFFYDKKKYRVIGVIRDYHYASLNEKTGPQLFITDPHRSLRDVYIKINPNETAETLRSIASIFKAFFPFQPYECNFKDEQNALQYESEGKWKQIISFGAILTIFISCIGLFGLATLAAEKRTKEIGIRKVLGASVAVIVRKLSNDFLRLVIIAAIIAAPLSWWTMNKWLENYPYRITINAWTFIIATLVVIMIAVLTISYQSIKSAIANPVKSLRSE